jgi:1-phosphofructokinase
MKDPARPNLAVFAPSPVLTVTIEAGDEQGPEIHYHPGGQGIWVARMAAALGGQVVLCVALAGEAGDVLEGLLPADGVEIRSVRAHGRSGSYIHDRRSGERLRVAATAAPRLWRHETDELYGVMLAAGLEAELAVLTGPWPPDAVPRDVYRRLASDLRTNGIPVIADLADGALLGALDGGLDLLKISHEELIEGGRAADADARQLLRAALELHEAGAKTVLVSRGAAPALALVAGQKAYELVGPRLEARDPTGTGDSMFGALATALASGRDLFEALRLAAAAGALNVTRSGLGTGRRSEIERLTSQVQVRALDPAAAA